MRKDFFIFLVVMIIGLDRVAANEITSHVENVEERVLKNELFSDKKDRELLKELLDKNYFVKKRETEIKQKAEDFLVRLRAHTRNVWITEQQQIREFLPHSTQLSLIMKGPDNNQILQYLIEKNEL